jgi:periplasmic divalent cation tolerance protein
MTDAILIIVTCPDEKNAQDIASLLIEGKHAACVQLSEINSMFWWDGKIQQRPEWRLDIKTISSQFETVQKLIRKHHPYEVPAIEMIQIKDGNADFLDWIKDSVS